MLQSWYLIIKYILSTTGTRVNSREKICTSWSQGLWFSQSLTSPKVQDLGGSAMYPASSSHTPSSPKPSLPTLKVIDQVPEVSSEDNIHDNIVINWADFDTWCPLPWETTMLSKDHVQATVNTFVAPSSPEHLPVHWSQKTKWSCWQRDHCGVTAPHTGKRVFQDVKTDFSDWRRNILKDRKHQTSTLMLVEICTSVWDICPWSNVR